MTEPLISCLAVTLPVAERFAFLTRSITDYQRQTHSNRELVLVLNGGDPTVAELIRDHVAALRDPGIRVVEPAGSLTLGALRNISIEHAGGEIICQWDDDDFYHPERLARQFDALGDGDAVFLRITAKAVPEQQVPLARAIRERLKLAFDRAGIIIPVLTRPLPTLPSTSPTPRIDQ